MSLLTQWGVTGDGAGPKIAGNMWRQLRCGGDQMATSCDLNRAIGRLGLPSTTSSPLLEARQTMLIVYVTAVKWIDGDNDAWVSSDGARALARGSGCDRD